MSLPPSNFPTAKSDAYLAACPKTSWTEVRRACAEGEDAASSLKALNELCRAYWPPMLAWCMGKGYSHSDAEDLVQGFFAKVIEKNYLNRADQDRGRLRCFLRTCLKHHVGDVRDYDQAAKRDSRVTDSLDSESTQGLHEPVDMETPDRAYDREWARTLLLHVLAEVGQIMAAEGKGQLFEHLKCFLDLSQTQIPSQTEVAVKLGTTAKAISYEVDKLRKLFGKVLQRHVEDSLDAPSRDQTREEIAYLSSLFS